MKKTNLFSLLFTFVAHIIIATSLFYFSNQFPNIFDIEREQQTYERTITNPHPMSAEEVTTFVSLSMQADKAAQELIENLLKGFKLIGFILLALAFNIGLVVISIYKEKKYENC